MIRLKTLSKVISPWRLPHIRLALYFVEGSKYQRKRHYEQYEKSWLNILGATTAAALAFGTYARRDRSLCHYRRFEDFYKLLERNSPIGVGSYGTVCAAAHRETGEVVAVKQIPRNSVTAKEVMSEVEILRVAGDHRHIIKLMDLFWDDDFWYVVMEMAHGGELFDRIVNKGLLSEHDACTVMQDLLHAIEFLHMHNIVHGDIKPENIMIAEESSNIDVRIGDFGTAFEVMGHKNKGHDNEEGGMMAGSSRMTVAYSPPEVLDQGVSDENIEVGPKADVWALGVLMYILIAGRHPFDMEPGADEQELQRHICLGEPDFSDQLWQGVSQQAIDIIKKMLSKDPTIRPTCTEALAHPWFDNTEYHSRATPAEACEAFQHFCEGRRRIKACLLAVMVGIIDTSGSDNGDESVNQGATPKSGFYEGRRALTRLGFGPHAIGSRTVACKLMDRLGKGYIDGDDLTAVMRAMGEKLTEQDISGMLKAIDGDPLGPNPSGQITYDQMSRLVPPLCPARKFLPGEVVYEEGELDDTFYLIKQGLVQFNVSSPTGEQVLQGLSAGDSFGEVELVQNKGTVLPRVCSCICSPDSPERCELMAVTHQLFSLLTDVFTSVRHRIEAQTNLRLHQLAGEILRRGFFTDPLSVPAMVPAWPNKTPSDACAMIVLSGTVAATWPDDALLPPHPPQTPEEVTLRVDITRARTEVLHAGDFCFCGNLGSLGGHPGEQGAKEVIGYPGEGGAAEVLVIPGEEFRKLIEQENMKAMRSYLFGVS